MSRMRRRVRSLLVLLACLIPGCHSPRTEQIRLFAAVSTKEAIEQIVSEFQAETGTGVQVNLGASSDLARQAEHGAVADLLLSADEAWADYLAEKNLVDQRRDLLTNRLVAILPAGSALEVHTLRDLTAPAIRRLALAGPAVPAGRYAREALRHAEVWDQLEKRVLDGGDVRATLAYVIRSEADAGLVYATDALGNDRVKIAFTINPEYHTPIRYPLVLIRQTPVKTSARQLFEYLGSEKASETFRKAGFGIAGH